MRIRIAPMITAMALAAVACAQTLVDPIDVEWIDGSFKLDWVFNQTWEDRNRICGPDGVGAYAGAGALTVSRMFDSAPAIAFNSEYRFAGRNRFPSEDDCDTTKPFDYSFREIFLPPGEEHREGCVASTGASWGFSPWRSAEGIPFLVSMSFVTIGPPELDLGPCPTSRGFEATVPATITAKGLVEISSAVSFGADYFANWLGMTGLGQADLMIEAVGRAIYPVNLQLLNAWWNEDGVDFIYVVEGTPPYGEATAALYWSRSERFEDRLSTVPAATTTIAMIGHGRNDPLTSVHLPTCDTPLGATHALIYLDAEDRLGERTGEKADNLRAVVAGRSGRSFELVDAKPKFLGLEFPADSVAAGALTPTDLFSLDTSPYQRTGAVADGVTKLVVRFKATKAGTVTFSHLEDLIGGGFTAIDSRAAPVRRLEVAPSFSSEDDWLGDSHLAYFALFTVPPELGPGENWKDVTLQADFTPECGAPETWQMVLRLEPPPVLLVHGTWSSPATWMTEAEDGIMDHLLHSSRRVKLVDWSDLGAKNFAAKRGLFWPALLDLEADYNSRGMAFTQCDVVAHSQGGLLVRLFAQDVLYRVPDNFNRGWFRRFISLAVPHLGSEIANVTYELMKRLDPLHAEAFKFIARAKGKAIDEGAVEDQRVGSPALQGLQEIELNTHFITDDCTSCWGSDELAVMSFLQYLRVQYLLTGYSLSFSDPPLCLDLNGGMEAAVQSVFLQRLNDTTVSLLSQSSWRSTDATESNFTPMAHGDITRDPRVAERVVDLLAGPDSAFLRVLPAVRDVYEQTGYSRDCSAMTGVGSLPGHHRARGPKPANPPAASGPLPIVITAPLDDAKIPGGGVVEVRLASADASKLAAVFVLVSADGFDASAVLTNEPFARTFTVPRSVIGPVTISAFATAADGRETSVPATRVLAVEPQDELVSLSVLPPELRLTAQGRPTQLHVTGTFSDGTKRDVTHWSTGLRYSSAADSIVHVGDDGLVNAVSNGVTALRITGTTSKGGIQVTVPSRVEFFEPRIARMTPRSVGVDTESSVTIEGTGFGGLVEAWAAINGVTDPAVSFTDLAVNAFGTMLTGKLVVSRNANPGPRRVFVHAAGGLSGAYGQDNVLTIVDKTIRMDRVGVGTRGVLEFEMSGPADAEFVVESSADLFGWTAIHTNRFVLTPVRVEDPSPLADRRFYRARLR